MGIRVSLNNGQSFNVPHGIAYMDGPQLVTHRLQEDEGSVSKFEVLAEIVGRLVERLPEEEWLHVVGSTTLIPR